MTCEQVCGECPRVPLGTALVPAAGGGADVLIWGWRRLYQLTRPSCPTLYCIRSIIPSPQGSTVAPSVYTTPILPTPTLRLNEAGATAGRGASYLPAPGSYVRVGYRQVQAGQAGRRSVLITACCLPACTYWPRPTLLESLSIVFACCGHLEPYISVGVMHQS